MTQPVLATQVAGVGRIYRHPLSGEEHPSVTTVLQALAKPALVGWAARAVAKAAWRQRDALARIDDEDAAVAMLKSAPWRDRDHAADVGTTIHEWIEALVRGEEGPKLSDEHLPYVLALQRFIDDWEPTFLRVEATVFADPGPGLRYAGTMDFIARLGCGQLVIGDWKTGSGIYPEVALQLTALRHASEIWDPATGDLEPMPLVDAALAVHLRPEGCRVHPVRADQDTYATFLALRRVWEWMCAGDAVEPQTTPERFARRAFEEEDP